DIGQCEQEDTRGVPADVGASYAFLGDTDASNDRRDGRLGFDTSPWSWFSLNAHYRNRCSDTDYDHRLDLAVNPATGALIENPGYSAFIRHREIDTDEAMVKLVLRPVNWLRTTFSFQRVTTDYFTITDPGTNSIVPEGLMAGRYEANIYGVGLRLSPFHRFYLSGNFSYSDSRTGTAQHGDASVAPYKGNIYSIITSANYILNK